MSLPRNIQPTCAWARPRSVPRHPGAWSTCGLCGSPVLVGEAVVLAMRGDPFDHRPLDGHRAEHGQQRSHRAAGLEAAVGEQPVIADGDAQPGERVGDREHDQVLPVQGPAPRQPSAAPTSATGGTPKTIVRTTRSSVSCSIGTVSATPRAGAPALMTGRPRRRVAGAPRRPARPGRRRRSRRRRNCRSA